MRPLERLFNPGSIAVVGASADEYKAGYQMLYSLKDFPGELVPINPKAGKILGFKAYPNLKSIGKPVDLVVMTIPAASCVDALKEAGEAGAGAALIISGGFAETGDTGGKVQSELLAVCKKYGIRLLGPNTAGYVNPKSRIFPNFNPWSSEVRPGKIGLVSQSGAMSLTLAALVHTQNLGLSLATGIGNGADVNVADAVEYLAEDVDTKVIMLYLEGIRDGKRLYDVIRKTTDIKPVIVLTVGKGDIAEFAVSHTGNLIGSYKVKIAALKQAGAVIAGSSDDLVDAANLLSRIRLLPKENPGVGLLTGQAGPGMVIADHLRSMGVLIPELQPDTVEKIRKALPPLTFIRNPVDTSRPGGTFPDVLRAISLDPSVDILSVFAIDEPAVIDPVSVFKKAGSIKPVVFGTAGFPENITGAQASLSDMNIASYASPDRMAKAVRAVVEDSKAQFRKKRMPEPVLLNGDVKRLDCSPDEAEAKDILNSLGIPTPERYICASREEAQKAFHRLRKPVVAKVLDAAIRHKTEAGGVILGISTEEMLEEALDRIDAIHGNNKRYLIEENAENSIEAIIGAKRDPGFGPVVMAGLGGTAAEALEDVSMRIAPLALCEAKDMIMELRGKSLFTGWRGTPPLDVESLAEAVVRIGLFMAGHPEIREMDLNPVRVYKKGMLALDALMIVDDNFIDTARKN